MPHASIALNVLVCEALHPVSVTDDVDSVVTVAVPHASVAVAVPSEASMFVGLHPSTTLA